MKYTGVKSLRASFFDLNAITNHIKMTKGANDFDFRFRTAMN
jgi:hypothetical protein